MPCNIERTYFDTHHAFQRPNSCCLFTQSSMQCSLSVNGQHPSQTEVKMGQATATRYRPWRLTAGEHYARLCAVRTATAHACCASHFGALRTRLRTGCFSMSETLRIVPSRAELHPQRCNAVFYWQPGHVCVPMQASTSNTPCAHPICLVTGHACLRRCSHLHVPHSAPGKHELREQLKGQPVGQGQFQ